MLNLLNGPTSTVRFPFFIIVCEKSFIHIPSKLLLTAKQMTEILLHDKIPLSLDHFPCNDTPIQW